MIRWIAIGVACVLVYGCASAPNPRLQTARAAVHKLSTDAAVKQAAPSALAAAQAGLKQAEETGNRAEATHRADLVMLRVQIARELVRAADARHQAQKDRQRSQAIRKQIQQLKAQRRAARQRARQKAERRKRQQARAAAQRQARLRKQVVGDDNQAATVAQRLQQMRIQLAELSPSLTEQGLRVTVGDVMFAGQGKASLKPYARLVLKRLAALLQANPGHTIAHNGYTDNRGQAKKNQALSLARAQAVAGVLEQDGVTAKRIQVHGLGERNPRASNTTASGRRQNRRVEVIIQR